MINLEEMTAVILAGGFGTRLREALPDCPKVLAPVAGKPFLVVLIDWLSEQGVRNFVVCTGYEAERVESTVAAYANGRAIDFSRETEPLGTGGAVVLARDTIPTETLLLMNGDTFCPFVLSGFVSFVGSLPDTAAGAIVVQSIEDTTQSGRVDVDAKGRILSFVEKGEAEGKGLVNAGMYCLRRGDFDAWQPGTPVSLEREILPAMLEQGLYAYRAEAPFLDIGTPKTYRMIESFLAEHDLI